MQQELDFWRKRAWEAINCEARMVASASEDGLSHSGLFPLGIPLRRTRAKRATKPNDAMLACGPEAAPKAAPEAAPKAAPKAADFAEAVRKRLGGEAPAAAAGKRAKKASTIQAFQGCGLPRPGGFADGAPKGAKFCTCPKPCVPPRGRSFFCEELRADTCGPCTCFDCTDPWPCSDCSSKAGDHG